MTGLNFRVQDGSHLTGRRAIHGLAAAAIIVLSLACGSSGLNQENRQPGPVPVPVVATMALLADIVENVGGDLVDVTAIVPPGADVHSFQSTPDDSVFVSRAEVIVSNGGGLDAFLDPMLDASKSADAVRVVASEGLSSPAEALGGDPHFWQNPLNTISYVEQVRDGLSAADPDHATAFRANAASYIQELEALDREIVTILDAVPEDQRRIYSFHDAFGHFADRYGWTSTGLLSGDADDATPGELVKIVQQARQLGIKAFFTEPQFDSALLKRAAEEAGVGTGKLYSDSLDGQVTTYVDMMRFNANSLAEYLK